MFSRSIGGARKSSEHCQGTLEQGAKLQNFHIWPCNDLESHPGVYLLHLLICRDASCDPEWDIVFRKNKRTKPILAALCILCTHCSYSN